MSTDNLGDRQKRAEGVTRMYLPQRTNMMIRADGRSFHTYTRGCKRPFDDDLMAAMDETAIALCEEIQGAKLAYVQSDEITIWATDYDDITTSPWFDGNIQKIASVSAAIATARFNQVRYNQNPPSDGLGMGGAEWDAPPPAHFDSRVWTIAQLSEVANCFLWRSNDAARNSVQMLARSLYSHKECENKNSSQLQEMCWQKGQNWNDLASRYKCGGIIVRESEPHIATINGVETSYIRNTWKCKEMTSYDFSYWMNLVKERAPL